MIDYYIVNCDICGRDGCNRNCLCDTCNDGPGCHAKGCPEEPGISEEEMKERLMKSPYIESYVRELQSSNENLYQEIERLEKELESKK